MSRCNYKSADLLTAVSAADQVLLSLLRLLPPGR